MGRGLALFGVLIGVTACTALAGVDQFTEGPCAGGCDGEAIDATADASKDAASDVGPSGDASSKDAGADATKDGSTGGDCGAIDTPLNCTACGASCDVLHSNSATCNGATCVYASCHAGWSDCDTTAPNLNGCECNTPACCGGSCQTTHANGLGGNYYDCVDAGTYDTTQATAACASYTSNQAACSASGCTGPGSNMVVCGSSGGICVCWDYSGSNMGHVYSSGSASCYCPGSTDPSWN